MAQKTIYKPVADGEWVRPRRRGYRLACCDCGLVHRMNFRLRDGEIQFQAFREPKSTGGKRRAMRVKLTKT